MPSAETRDTIIGASIAIAASVFNAVGYTIQKKGHNRLKEYNKDKEKKKKIIKEKTWAIGFGIYLIGGILNAVALFYAPQSLVLPLSAITLVVNTGLATKVLDEPFFKTDICGMISVIIGSSLAVIFGPRTAGGETTMNDLKVRWGDADFFYFIVILSSLMAVDYLLVRYYEKKNTDDESVMDVIQHGKELLLLSYCLLAGYFGSLAFLFLKSFTEFIGSSVDSKEKADANAQSWYSYFTIICVVLANFALEFWRQRGLSYFHAVYVVPINQVVLIVMGSVMGGLYFEEFSNMSAVDGVMFTLAILITVVGVFVLAFNSGNVAEKTDVQINHNITMSLDGNNLVSNLPAVIGASPTFPITRTATDHIPDLPPAGMAGPIVRLSGLHHSMVSMHFTRDGKPFYLTPDKLMPLQHIVVPKQASVNSSSSNGRVKRGNSVPTWSGSSLAEIVEEAHKNGSIATLQMAAVRYKLKNHQKASLANEAHDVEFDREKNGLTNNNNNNNEHHHHHNHDDNNEYIDVVSDSALASSHGHVKGIHTESRLSAFEQDSPCTYPISDDEIVIVGAKFSDSVLNGTRPQSQSVSLPATTKSHTDVAAHSNSGLHRSQSPSEHN
eukprot:CAMPEP_0202712596 /NCGR_PEP_ID=MMETSP1385-20130828/43531_1 /ASSEMBLY_ACC=CAM_ASM_000861 /TAXON_ID=933848 /ORGANISM="Elphidium margaritaceum" /LENGTH=610 /DNA_ID=CAMNT_0049372683 /DNA_START=77 /DNA_END=1909 /DNA_ORIENTATION=-